MNGDGVLRRVAPFEVTCFTCPSEEHIEGDDWGDAAGTLHWKGWREMQVKDPPYRWSCPKCVKARS